MPLIRFVFRPNLPRHELESSLVLAMIACEGLHGETTVQLDSGFRFDKQSGVLAIDISSDVGRDLAKVFTQFLRRSYGEGSFRVERLDIAQPAEAA